MRVDPITVHRHEAGDYGYYRSPDQRQRPPV